MPPPDVSALADQVAEQLAAGAFAEVGQLDLGPEGSLEAALAARVALADLEHWTYLERARRRVPRAQWAHLAEQLRRLLWYTQG